MDKGLVEQMLAAAASIVGSGAISANGHGNVSLRVPGAEEMYFTSAPSLKELGPDGVARVALDGTLLEGSLPPIQGAVVAMHTATYLDRPDVGCVLHTHSPFAPPRLPSPTARSDAGSRPWRCSAWPTTSQSPRTGREDRNRRSPTSARPSGPACPPCCWPTTGSSSSTGRPSLLSSSAAWSKRRRRRRWTPGRWRSGRDPGRPPGRRPAAGDGVRRLGDENCLKATPGGPTPRRSPRSRPGSRPGAGVRASACPGRPGCRPGTSAPTPR